jgi:Fe-S-cluster-containing dehydrogenase component
MDSQPVIFHRTLPGALTRRRAMAWMAASAALAGAGCNPAPRERIHPWVGMPPARGADDPLFYATAVARDGHAQGVLVATREGRPIKVEGNPLHPSSLGATDPLAQAAVLELWDPDRSQAVTQALASAAPTTAMRASALSTWSAYESAWRPYAARLRGNGGDGLRLLTGPITSPTLRAQLARWLQAHPHARWHQHAPLRDEAAEAGAMAAFHQPVQVVARVDRARTIAAFGCDPFSEGPGCVRHAMDWAVSRRGDLPPSLFAAEVQPGLFGARADGRIALGPAQIDELIQRLATRLRTGQAAPDAEAGVDGFEAQLLVALRSAGPATLLFAGSSLSPASHAALHAIHQQLGATGQTVRLLPPLAWAPEAGTLAQLVRDMRQDAVDTLVVLDANPMYDAPGELRFNEALRRVRFSVHAGVWRDETARACDWHLPLSHAFEQWGDARAHDGTVTLLQPSITPLYDTRSLHELVALLAGEAQRDGYAIVQGNWRAAWGARFEATWRDSLRQGFVEGSAPAPLRMRAAPSPPVAAESSAPGGTMRAVFSADPSAHDGRHANNAWLQELPRPFTKHTWENAALLGTRSAAAAGLATGDRVRIQGPGGYVVAPVWVMALHAEGVVTLPLGYGRRAAGRVGNGLGFDAYRLRPAAGAALVHLEKLPGERHVFALTQHSQDPAGRSPVRSIAPGERAAPQRPPRPSLYPEEPADERAWAMVIDLDACIGCNACTIACQAENNIPVVGPEEVARGHYMHWIRVDRYDSEDPAGSVFQPVPCMHCEKAPCELVCPVGATIHDVEGLNVQVYNRCIGTRFCSNNCPYKVRRFNFLQYSDETTESLKGQRNPEVSVRRRGVMEKCTYCLHRIARARQHAQANHVQLADGDVLTACQAVCPTQAIHFGDLRAPASEVSRMRASPRHYTLLEELDTRPRTTYLARLRQPRT